MKKVINTDKAPGAVGPYSQGIMAGDFLFISGQLPLDPSTMKIVGSNAADQTDQALKNMGAILEEAGLGYENLVKVTVLLNDMNDFVSVNEVYAKFFSSDFPARASFQVARLPLDAFVEIEAIAYKG